MHYREILRERKRLDRIKRLQKKSHHEPPQPRIEYVKELTLQHCKPTQYSLKGFPHCVGTCYIYPNGLMYANVWQGSNSDGNYQYCDLGKCTSERDLKLKKKRRKLVICDSKFVWFESNYICYNGSSYCVAATELNYTSKRIKIQKMKKHNKCKPKQNPNWDIVLKLQS
jgi:hypothetical protein